MVTADESIARLVKKYLNIKYAIIIIIGDNNCRMEIREKRELSIGTFS